MTHFAPKTYQQSVLDSIEAYFRACHELPSPGIAFTTVTERLWGWGLPYRPLAGFPPDMPYFCLRLPTGGGKTWLAARSVALINTHLLRTPHSVILWLVPSRAIRDQTLNALQNRAHPYHAALQLAGPLTVLDLEQAQSLTRATLDTSTTVIVATRQAFQVENADIRKVYASSGALLHHFEQLTAAQRAALLTDDDTIPCSLANLLRLRRPFLIVDEAHNSRTELAFDTLARFRPSGILELTATPDTVKTPSNVLHSVSAAELKIEEMIKLPILLVAEPDWRQCLADAIARRNELQVLADAEQRVGATYLRPLVLIQAEKRRQGVETLDAERVRQALIDHHRIPPEEIVIATGEEKGLEKIAAAYPDGIADPRCPVHYLITQQALAEGWDCPFAYLLVSMAALHSATAVEQLLGRVLRQPQAQHRAHPALNQSYAFVVSRDFAATANALRDRLVQGAGFERREVQDFVAAARTEQAPLDLEPGLMTPALVALPETPDLDPLPQPLRAKLAWDALTATLTLTQPLSVAETQTVQHTVASEPARQAIAQAATTQRDAALAFFQTPAERGVRFRAPHIAISVQGKRALFDDPELLDYPWTLSPYDAHLQPGDVLELAAADQIADGGEIDIDAKTGALQTRFIAELQRDLGLAYRPEHWDEVQLAAWLCRNLPDPTLTHASKQALVAGWLQELLARDGYALARANRQKFVIRNLLERRIRELRAAAARQAYQQTLFGPERETRVTVDDALAFEFPPHGYAPSRDYDGRFGHFAFRRHYYGRIGDFDSREEFECAAWLDTQAQKGRIDFWVRNLVRKEGGSFFLQKADGRFYPDFLCQLPDAAILAVEYKGADRWRNAENDRLIGGLWEERSGGRCRFVMITERNWTGIDRKLAPHRH